MSDSDGEDDKRDKTPLERAIEAQELLRGHVPDEVISAAIASLREAIGDASPPEQPSPSQRRFVTVLFADLVGFTSFSEAHDHEFVATTINELWDVVDAEIIRLGGRVDKHMGDAVMGVWGTNRARESDAELAVRAALQMQERFAEFSRRRSAELGMRVGIGTGYAFSSAIGASGEWSVTGDTVNTASRMEHAAPPGGILVTESTRNLLGDTFATEEVPPFAVKGKDGLLRAHLVLGLRSPERDERRHRAQRTETPLVGRAREVARLREAFESTQQRDSGSVVLCGESGVGKSALMADFSQWLESLPNRPLILRGRSLEFSQSRPLAVIRDIVWRHLEIAQDESVEAAFERVGTALSGPDDRTGYIVASWLGLDVPGSVRQPALAGPELATTARVHLRHYLERLASDGGVVIAVEDLQWADAESLAVLHEIAPVGPSPLMMVGTTRSTGEQLDAECGPADAVQIAPLSAGAIKEVAIVAFQRSDVPGDLLDRIAEISHGNPLHAEEIVRSILASGWTPVSGAAGSAIVDRLPLPTSLAGAFQARLDALGPVDRLVLQCAAVVGRRFWNRSIVHVLEGRHPAVVIEQSIEALEWMGVISRRDRSAFQSCEEFRFTHGLMRNAAYETVLLDDRRVFHAVMVDWLDERAGDRTTEFAGELADHLIGAGQAARAVRVLATAAERAMAIGALKSAMAMFERTLDLRGDAPPDQDGVELMIDYGWAQHLAGAPTRAEPMLAEATRLARRLGFERLAWRSSLLHTRALMGLGRWDDAADALAVLREPAVELGPSDEVEVALALAALAEAGDEPGSGLEHVERAIAVARRNDLDDGLVRGLGELTWSLLRHDRFAEARGAIEEALDIAIRLGDLERQASLIMNKAVLNHFAAHDDPTKWEPAMAMYREARERFEELGSTVGRLRAQGNLAQAEAEIGEVEVARRRALDVLRVAWDAELAVEWGLGLIVIAQIELTIGDDQLGHEILGVLVHDPRIERWDDQIERTLTLTGHDPMVSWPRIREATARTTDDVVAGLLERPTAPT